MNNLKVVDSRIYHFKIFRSCQQKYDNLRGRDLAIVRTLALCQDAVLHAK
jgi:hypothetical protein